MELTAKQSRAVSVTTLAFPGDSTNNFILGSEDGVIYSGQRHGNKKVCNFKTRAILNATYR